MTYALTPTMRFVYVERAVNLTSVEGEIEGYVYIWGDPDHRDQHGTYFDKTRPPTTDLENGMHRRPIKYEHGYDAVILMETIGWIDEIWHDGIGLRFRGHLDRASRFFARIVSELQAGKLATSSSTLPNMMRFTEDGAFEHWTVGELSLTSNPSETRMPAVAVIRSAPDAEREAPRADDPAPIFAEPTPPDETVAQPEPETSAHRSNLMTISEIVAAMVAAIQGGESPQAVVDALNASGLPPETLAAISEGLKAEIEQQEAPAAMPEMAMQSATGAQPPAPAQGRSAPQANGLQSLVGLLRTAKSAQEAAAAQEQRIQKLVTDAVRAAVGAPPPPAHMVRSTSSTQQPQITGMSNIAYAGLKADDLLFAAVTLRSNGRALSEELLRETAGRLHEAAEADKIPTPGLRSFVRSRRVDGLVDNLRSNELMATGIATQGQEWITPAYADFVWDKIRTDTQVIDLLIQRGAVERQLAAGEASAEIYTADSDPTVIGVPEATDLDATNRPAVNIKPSKFTTGKLSVSPGELKAAIDYTFRLEEDSIIPVAAFNNQRMQVVLSEHVELLFINGDTATGANTNINLIDGTPGTGADTPYYIISDGMLKNALATSGRYRDNGGLGAFSQSDFHETAKLLTRQVRTKKGNLFFLADIETHEEALKFPSVLTNDVARAYTLETGRLPKQFGIDVFDTERMALAYTAGKISGTGSNNTRGRLACVFAPYWAIVYKRDITIETDRDIRTGTNLLVGSTRIRFQRRSTDASSVTFNIKVA